MKTNVLSNALNRRRLRRHTNVHFGGMNAVKAHPLAAQKFLPDEGGMVETNLQVMLAPVSGFMRSKAYLDVYQVFVPYQAIELLERDDLQDAGVTEMTKRRLMAGETIQLEVENDVSKAMNIKPRSIGGVKKVDRTVRLAYIAACNHLRRAAYHKATLALKTTTAILPATLTANVLERLNGVLEPESLIDGAISLTGEIPVKGIGFTVGSHYSPEATAQVRETGDANAKTVEGWHADGASTAGHIGLFIQSQDDISTFPSIFADLGSTPQNLTLRDMMESQELDRLIRELAGLVKKDPHHGEEVVARALYGLTVDFDATPQVLYHRRVPLTAQHQRPMDGPSMHQVTGHFEAQISSNVIVPRSQLGGQLVTIAMVKPLEVLSDQPDPLQTEAFTLTNRVIDETTLEEQLLTRADLESDLLAAEEDTETFWVGHNSLKFEYETQGPNDAMAYQQEMLSAMWVYQIPTSVSSDNVVYPVNGIDMYPFGLWNGAHAEYTIRQQATVSTPMAKGPNPVERIQLFADDPTLIEG